MTTTSNKPNSSKAGNPNWKRGCKSPNPTGRPRGITDKRHKLTELLENEADKVIRVVIDSALGGDVQAASLVLSRIAPTLKAQAEKVSFHFDKSLSMTEQVEHVLLAISQGELSPDTGKQIIESITLLAGMKQMDEFEQRLATLEAT